MFEKMYKTVDAKVEPSLNLINETKSKMKQEINNSNKVVHINFYKYATLAAACLVIFVGVLAVNTTNDISFDVVPSINESNSDVYQESVEISSGSNPFFNSAMSADSAFSTGISRKSVLDNISDFFINIIQWFKDLLF